MSHRIGILGETKNVWERRAPLTPDHVGTLVHRGLQVAVQSSEIRIFPDQAYRQAGATVADDLSDCPVVFAVKEIPAGLFQPGHVYVFFSHVIKGQPHNMPMLRRLLELGCTLIDYEKVADAEGRRLIFFGRYAGLAGMLDTLWALGRRLAREGEDTPLAALHPTHEYPDLDRAREAIRAVGARLGERDLPSALCPMVFGFAGYGHVSLGAQEIFDLLPHREVSPDELPSLRPGEERRRLIKVVFREEHMVEPHDSGSPFQLQEYYDHPERYRGVFARYLPALSVLVNCIYWDTPYPRLVTREFIHDLYRQDAPPRLRVIGDLSCDVEGSVECTLKCTDPGDPVYVYRAKHGDVVSGVEGMGPVILAVDNLPCELPVDASREFGDALQPYVEAIATTDYSRSFSRLDLPPAIRRAVIAHRGSLAPNYTYLSSMFDQHQGGSS